MRIFGLLIALVLVAASGERARADDTPSPEALAAARQLFTIVSGDMLQQLTTQITGAFWPSVEQSARSEKIDDATIAELRKEFDRVELAFVTDALKQAPAIYARHLPLPSSMNYRRSTKRRSAPKRLHEMPQVMGEFTSTLVPRLKEVQRQASEAFDKILRERGYKK